MDFHDSTFADVDNVIHSVARKHAKRFGLNWSQHGQDLVQAGWLGAARASSRYEARGWKYLTYSFYFISGDIRRACTTLAYQRHTTVTLDEAHDLTHSDDPDYTTAIRELLATPDGLELLACELGYRDQSKPGARIRKEQLDALRARYVRIKQAA